MTRSCETHRWSPSLPAAGRRRRCVPGQVCLHESGERGSQMVSGTETGLFMACRLFESLPGSLLAATHSAVQTPDTCGGQILNRMRGVGLWQNF